MTPKQVASWVGHGCWFFFLGCMVICILSFFGFLSVAAVLVTARAIAPYADGMLLLRATAIVAGGVIGCVGLVGIGVLFDEWATKHEKRRMQRRRVPVLDLDPPE